MAEQGDKSSVGAIRFDVVADHTTLDAGLAAAEAKVEKSAAKMEAAAKVRIGTNAGPMPIGDKSAARAVNETGGAVSDLNARAGTLNQTIRSSIGGFTQLVGTITRVTGVVGILVTALGTLAYAFTAPYRRSAEMRQELNRLGESIESLFSGMRDSGSSGLAKEFENIEKSAERMTREVNRSYVDGKIGRREVTRLMRLIETEVEYAKKAALEMERIRSAEAWYVREADERARNASESQKMYHMRKKQAIEDAIRAAEEEERKSVERAKNQEGRIRSLAEAANRAAAANPIDALGQRMNEAQRAIMEAVKNARNPIEATMAVAMGNAIVAGIKREKENIVRQFSDIIADAVNSALEQQAAAAGAQNATTLLRDIGVQIQAIQATIPRDYAGAMPGIAGAD